MNERLILLKDISGLGKAGSAVNISPGYARNYLLPKKLALRASKGAMRQLEAHKEKIEAQHKAEIEKIKATAKKIAELEITISMKVGEEDKLYGSVTSHTIADEIKALGIDVEHQKIVLKEPIKELGVYDVEIKLHPEVPAKARIWVVRA